jgi:hypothetical protein
MDSNYYNIKYPYILTLRKYWLEFKGIYEYPDYTCILDNKQLSLLSNILKNNIFENYILGNLNNDVKNNEEFGNFFNNISKKMIKNNNLGLIPGGMEENTELYKLFYNFENLNWIPIANDTIKKSENLTIPPSVNNTIQNNQWKYQNINIPSSTALQIKKDINFLLMEQDIKRFRNFETGLTCSQQLNYLKNKNMGNNIQEISSYIYNTDKSKYKGTTHFFDPIYSVPKKKTKFNPSINYNHNLYGISSSNLLTLQIVESMNNGVYNFKRNNNLSNGNIISSMKKNGIFNNSERNIIG